jgi:hypothetical protein
MNSYEENEMRKVGAKVQSCPDFALCAKLAQDYLRKYRLAPSIKRKVLRCTAGKATLFIPTVGFTKKECIIQIRIPT